GQKAKFNAVVEDIKDCHRRGQPVLVGTTSIETSEMLSGRLREAGVPHEVLNAKQHEREAVIVAMAGKPGAVTIATNMAGRGTDIVLGGNLEVELQALSEQVGDNEKAVVREQWKQRHEAVKNAGGLHIVGTERHESRRIDNQLRGRSGRQGDPGSSRFFLSFEDNLMRIFAADFIQRAMKMLRMKEDDVIESPMVSRQIEKAQRKVEAHNFDIRKNLLEFDDVNNDQRKVIYKQRDELLETESVADTVSAIRHDVVADAVRRFVPEHSVDEQWDLPGLERTLSDEFGIGVDLQGYAHSGNDVDAAAIARHAGEAAAKLFADKEEQIGAENMRALEKHVMLGMLDQKWKEHLAKMDYLRQGIHLRGYAQKQPKQEFKREAFEMFSEMLEEFKREVITLIARVRVRSQEEVARMEAESQRLAQLQARQMQFQHADSGGYGADEEAAQVQAAQQAAAAAAVAAPVLREGPKVGRNDPCPCGSGKKYKQCHGQLV
ncbi:MAG: SEC-C domain-containing protein, partial [Proteobacteria bacterium]|nr:SEC-C domain-containing protein [Pseudomonadota bacterium]